MAIAEDRFEWDLDKISSALLISPEDARLYFTDGRRVSFLLERRIAKEVLGGSLAPSEGAGYDVIDAQGGKCSNPPNDPTQPAYPPKNSSTIGR